MNWRHMPLPTLLTLCCVGMTAASAETIYRCANQYSQTPCPGAQVLRLDDARAPELKTNRDAATQRDRQWADTLEQDRLAREASLAAPVQLGNLKARPGAKKKVAPKPPVAVKPELNRPKKPKFKPEGFVARSVKQASIQQPAASR